MCALKFTTHSHTISRAHSNRRGAGAGVDGLHRSPNSYSCGGDEKIVPETAQPPIFNMFIKRFHLIFCAPRPFGRFFPLACGAASIGTRKC